MNILLLGEFSKENIDFFKQFENNEDIVVCRYWTRSDFELGENCFLGQSDSESFKLSMFNILFDLSFEPDIILIKTNNILESWGISAIKRQNYISSKCFCLTNEMTVPFDGLTLAILETFEKVFVNNSSVEMKKFLNFLKNNKNEEDVLEKICDSVEIVNDFDASILLKIIKGKEYSGKNIECSEIVI